MVSVNDPASTIELQVEKIGQLFNTLDPLPFRERDLASEAEEYIVSWARELPAKAPIRIVVHMPVTEAATEHAAGLSHALQRYFHYQSEIATGDLKELFRNGRYALVIGLCVLALCLLAGRLVQSAGQLGYVLNEGLVILGWVANWRPIEIFLYDWWPMARRKRLFERLARAEVCISAR